MGGATVAFPPVPPDWINCRRTLHLELRDGNRVVWQDTQLPHGTLISLGTSPLYLDDDAQQ